MIYVKQKPSSTREEGCNVKRYLHAAQCSKNTFHTSFECSHVMNCAERSVHDWICDITNSINNHCCLKTVVLPAG